MDHWCESLSISVGYFAQDFAGFWTKHWMED
jgi:hypothetical protein